MKTYTVIFEVPDDYKPIREFISCWFKDRSGKDVSLTKKLMDSKDTICDVKKMNNDLIDRTALLRKWDEKFFAMGGDRLGPNGDEIMWYLNSLLDEIKNAPIVPLPDFKEGYKQAIIDGKLNYGGRVVPDTLHGWIYEDKQITIEEYMQSLKGEN